MLWESFSTLSKSLTSRQLFLEMQQPRIEKEQVLHQSLDSMISNGLYNVQAHSVSQRLMAVAVRAKVNVKLSFVFVSIFDWYFPILHRESKAVNTSPFSKLSIESFIFGC